MDRRLAERRKRVAEDRARSNLSRLIRVLVVLALVAAVVWFAQSPFVSVGSIRVEGADRVDVMSVLDSHGVTEGRPMLVIDVQGAERALRQDPWVAEATVARDWPQTVVVAIEERRPAVRAELAEGAWLVADDGTLLDPDEGEGQALPRVVLADLDADAATEDLTLKGAVEFLVSLPDGYRQGAMVTRGTEGLEAVVAGYTVRVGRPFDTAEKAAVTAAMIDAGVEEGAILTVVAPANPAVLPPDAGQEEGEETGDETGEENPTTSSVTP